MLRNKLAIILGGVMFLLPSIGFASLKIINEKVQPVKFKKYPLVKFVEDYAVSFNKTVLSTALRESNKKVIDFEIAKEISKSHFEKMFYKVLNSKGFAVFPGESFVKIISSRDVRYTADKLYTSSDFPDEDRFILVHHILKNPLSQEITRNMRPFLSRYGRIISFKDGHTIVISDTGKNIKELLALIKVLDTSDSVKRLKTVRKKKKNNFKSTRDQEIEIEILELEKDLLTKKIKSLENKRNRK